MLKKQNIIKFISFLGVGFTYLILDVGIRFIYWKDIGFVSLRFRHNVYSDGNAFLSYMNETTSNNQFFTIQ